MAVSPQELEKNFVEETKKLELFIDNKLRINSVSKGGVVSMDIPSGMGIDHFRHLQKLYESVGWSEVKWNSDQREGSWLTFKY